MGGLSLLRQLGRGDDPESAGTAASAAYSVDRERPTSTRVPSAYRQAWSTHERGSEPVDVTSGRPCGPVPRMRAAPPGRRSIRGSARKVEL
jgi:hypothetical protein